MSTKLNNTGAMTPLAPLFIWRRGAFCICAGRAARKEQGIGSWRADLSLLGPAPAPAPTPTPESASAPVLAGSDIRIRSSRCRKTERRRGEAH